MGISYYVLLNRKLIMYTIFKSKITWEDTISLVSISTLTLISTVLSTEDSVISILSDCRFYEIYRTLLFLYTLTHLYFFAYSKRNILRSFLIITGILMCYIFNPFMPLRLSYNTYTCLDVLYLFYISLAYCNGFRLRILITQGKNHF